MIWDFFALGYDRQRSDSLHHDERPYVSPETEASGRSKSGTQFSSTRYCSISGYSS